MNVIFRWFLLVLVPFFLLFSGTAFADVFEVHAKQNSVSGGIPIDTKLSVSPGQILVISVDEKDTWSAGSGYRTSNANGLGNPLGNDFGVFKKDNFAFLYGSLVGSTDNGMSFFPIGTELNMPILTSNGVLLLYYWDSNNQDNSGSVSVTVNIHKID